MFHILAETTHVRPISTMPVSTRDRKSLSININLHSSSRPAAETHLERADRISIKTTVAKSRTLTTGRGKKDYNERATRGRYRWRPARDHTARNLIIDDIGIPLYPQSRIPRLDRRFRSYHIQCYLSIHGLELTRFSAKRSPKSLFDRVIDQSF